MGKYFGTDGIRGIPNKKLTIELMTRLGEALSLLGNKEVVIASDTRISKDMLGYAIASAAMSRGLNVHFVGVMPTPALIYYSYKTGYIGVMITASHNPYTDNGIKIINKGYKLSDAEEEMLEDYIDNPKPYEGEIGKLIYEDVKPIYYDFIDKYIAKSDLKIAIDCANGASFETAPYVFNKITNKLVVLANTPDGYNINRDCGSTHLDLLKKTVVEEKCDIGFAFDGDADRVLVANPKGEVIDGDKLIYLLARYLKSQGKLAQDTVVLSIMSNLGLIQDLKAKGINTFETKVGDRYVVEALMNNKLSIGGENSGHIILPEIFHTGDGVLNALLIMKVLSETNTKIDDWFKDVVMYADKMVNIVVKDKNKVLNDKELLNRIEEIKKEFNYDCKIIFRASGTEDLVRVSVMAKSKELVEKYSDELVNKVKSI